MASFSAICAALSLTSLFTTTMAQGSVAHTPSAGVPAGASLPLDPSFAGFGIEPSNLFSFTGGKNTNQLSVNLLQNLANYTGTPPSLRIGGNTQDYFKYDDTFTGFNIRNNPNPTVSSAAFPPDHMIIGPSFYEAIDRFPVNSPVTFGLNLAYEGSDFSDRLIALAKPALGFKNVKLTSFEIGNEVDLYLQNGFRTGAWGGAEYTRQWLERAQIVYDNVLQPAGLPANFFEPGCTASTIGTSFTINQLIQQGVTNPPTGSQTPFVARWNQHDYYYYIGVSKYQLTMDSFTDLSTTSGQFQAWEEQIGEATASGYRYALREMGVVGPIGMNGITDTFAAALWTMHFFLYAATLNISSVQMHMTDNSNASAWQPVFKYGNEPFVRPQYYAFAAMAQVIGCGGGIKVNGPGVLATSAPSGYANRVAIYDIYRDDKLESMVFLNTKIVDPAAQDKASVNFDLTMPDFAGQDLFLHYMTNDGTTSAHNTTWNGVSYEQDSTGIPTTVDTNDVQSIRVGDDGSVTVPVRDTQALVVKVGSAIDRSQVCPATATINAGLGSATQKSGSTKLSPKIRFSGGACSTTTLMTTLAILMVGYLI